ncbi:diaminopimelate epimerase [Krasilnikovia sp. MM14-A1004]|uniref:diaminopimelate epimerase n=1 Tax=Krasilnikovia sp. MM14-A1004 TaxID=3373541 RepID=UPI00399CA964
MEFAKGHGTENDFVIVPDPGGRLELTPEQVAALCNRRTGIGADGVLRVARCQHAKWFMDYRNADGSIPEMCGNGLRVFARYLVEYGLAAPGRFDVVTRAGLRSVELEMTGDVTADMGPARVLGTSTAVIGDRRVEGLHITVGNPHLACVVESPVETFDLSTAPGVDIARFPDGVNVEVVRLIGDHCAEMRVYERGVGTTWSCGTGVVASAVAAARSVGEEYGEWEIRVPGGSLTVILNAESTYLRGPAVIVAEGKTSLLADDGETEPSVAAA